MPDATHRHDEYFRGVEQVRFEGVESKNPLAFRYYDKDRMVLGRRMEDHLRPAVCYWHSFCWDGADIFGAPAFHRPWLESVLGCPLGETLTFEIELPFGQLAAESLLDGVRLDRGCLGGAATLRPAVGRWAVPPGVSPEKRTVPVFAEVTYQVSLATASAYSGLTNPPFAAPEKAEVNETSRSSRSPSVARNPPPTANPGAARCETVNSRLLKWRPWASVADIIQLPLEYPKSTIAVLPALSLGKGAGAADLACP